MNEAGDGKRVEAIVWQIQAIFRQTFIKILVKSVLTPKPLEVLPTL